MFKNLSTTDVYPKTLLIRNQVGGLVWQVYHVQKLVEAERLAANSRRNGFEEATLVEYDPEYKENWPDWRETDGGKKICE